MTVGELVEALKNFDPQLEVMIGYEDIEVGERTSHVVNVMGRHVRQRYVEEDTVVLGDCNFTGRGLGPMEGTR